MIETCCIPRYVELNGKGFKLAPPTVQQAIEILHVLDHIEEDEDVDLLADLICALDWSPSLALNRGFIIRAYEESPVRLKVIMYQAITQGFDLKKVTKDAKESDKESTKTDYSVLIESYRNVYGGSRHEVLTSVPFALLLESMNTVKRDRALQNIRQASVNNPSKDTIEAWTSDINSEEYKDKEALMFEDLTEEEIEKEKALARKQYTRN